MKILDKVFLEEDIQGPIESDTQLLFRLPAGLLHVSSSLDVLLLQVTRFHWRFHPDVWKTKGEKNAKNERSFCISHNNSKPENGFSSEVSLRGEADDRVPPRSNESSAHR